MFHVEQGRKMNSLSQNLTVLPAPSEREPTLSVTAYAVPAPPKGELLACRPQASSPSQALRASSPKGRATGETGDFAICPITFPLCQRPHPRGGCLRPTGADWGSSDSYPLSLLTAFAASSPEGGAFGIFRPARIKLPLRGSWHGVSRD